MSLATWFRRWNSPEARRARKKARHDTWVESNRQADAMRAEGGPGPMQSRRYSVYEEGAGYNPPQD